MSEVVICFVVVLRFLLSGAPAPRFFEAIRTQAFHIRRRIGIEHRLDDMPANSGRTRYAMRVAAAGHHKSFDAAALANNESTVWRKRWPAFEHTANAHLLDG